MHMTRGFAYLVSLLFVALLLQAFSCYEEPCKGVRAEPTVVLMNNSSRLFTSISSPDTKENRNFVQNGQQQFELSLGLADGQTRFVFVDEQQQEYQVVFETRYSVRFESQLCGVTAKLTSLDVVQTSGLVIAIEEFALTYFSPVYATITD